MSRFFSFAAIAAASLLVSSPSAVSAVDVCNGDDYGTPGQFDFYILELSWPAQFCTGHASEPGCSNPTAWQQTNFTLHGLWPNYNQAQGSHEWPQCCNTGAGSDIDPNVVTQLLPQLQTYWPSEQNPNPSGSDLSKSLWAHEWAKHGTCTGLDQLTYLSDAMSLLSSPVMATPSLISKNIGGNVDPNQIEAIYNSGAACDPNAASCMVGLSCSGGSGNQALSGLLTCWDPSLNRIACPKAVLGKGCTDPTVYITSFSDVQAKRNNQHNSYHDSSAAHHSHSRPHPHPQPQYQPQPSSYRRRHSAPEQQDDEEEEDEEPIVEETEEEEVDVEEEMVPEMPRYAPRNRWNNPRYSVHRRPQVVSTRYIRRKTVEY